MLFTYVIGVIIGFITKQINFKDIGQMLTLRIIYIFIIVIITIFLIRSRNNLKQIHKEIKKLRL